MDLFSLEEEAMKQLKVLGPGCSRCEQLAQLVRAASEELGLEYELEKITDFDKFIDYGVMMTPGLVIAGEVKSVGRVPSLSEIKDMLKKIL